MDSSLENKNLANPYKPLLIAGVLVGLGASLLLLWDSNLRDFAADPFLRYLSIAILLAFILAWGLRWGSVSLSKGKTDLLELPVWYSIWVFGGYVLLGFLVFNHQMGHQEITLRSLQWVADGLGLLLVGFLGLWVGYRFAWLFLQNNHSQRALTKKNTDIRQPIFGGTVAVYFLSILARLVHLGLVGTAFGSQVDNLGGFSGFNQWFNYAEQARFFLIAIIALQVFQKRWPFQVLIVALFLEIAYTLLSGFTMPFIWLSLTIWASYVYVGRQLQLSRRVWVLILSLCVVILIALPVSVQYRGLISRGTVNNRSVSSVGAGFATAFTSTRNDRDATFAALSNKIFDRQQAVVQSLGIILHTTPETIPYWGVDRLLLIPFYTIPRIVWPSKPNLSTGNYFAIAYLGSPQSATNSAATTMVGDLYLNAGWGAVLVGMFFWGIVCAVLYYYLHEKPLKEGNLPVVALYIGLAVLLADFEGTYIGLSVGLMQRVVVFGALFFLLHPKTKRRRFFGKHRRLHKVTRRI